MEDRRRETGGKKHEMGDRSQEDRGQKDWRNGIQKDRRQETR